MVLTSHHTYSFPNVRKTSSIQSYTQTGIVFRIVFDPFINSYMLQGAGIIIEKKK